MNTISNKIFDFIYTLAMRDATLQKAYQGDKSKIACVSASKQKVKVFIERIVGGDYRKSSQSKYDSDFVILVKAVCLAINTEIGNEDETHFTFGNAQKLINMTIKYTYISTIESPELREYFRFCHCPMDNIIINHIWKKCGSDNTNIERRNILGRFEDFSHAWSQMELLSTENSLPKQYEQFQKIVREYSSKEGLSPIEYDFFHWGEGKVE